jgi:hypothetical protein
MVRQGGVDSVTAIVRFSRPSWFDASVTARYVGQQYEDDLNTLSLGSYFVMDAIVSRAIIGSPFTVRGGGRFRF